MTKNRFAWYEESEGPVSPPACGNTGYLPCSRVDLPDGSMELFDLSVESSSPLQKDVDALAKQVNDFFEPKAKKLIEQIRASDEAASLPNKDELELRMVIKNSGIRLVLAACTGRPVVDLEKVIKAGKQELENEPIQQ